MFVFALVGVCQFPSRLDATKKKFAGREPPPPPPHSVPRAAVVPVLCVETSHVVAMATAKLPAVGIFFLFFFLFSFLFCFFYGDVCHKKE